MTGKCQLPSHTESPLNHFWLLLNVTLLGSKQGSGASNRGTERSHNQRCGRHSWFPDHRNHLDAFGTHPSTMENSVVPRPQRTLWRDSVRFPETSGVCRNSSAFLVSLDAHNSGAKVAARLNRRLESPAAAPTHRIVFGFRYWPPLPHAANSLSQDSVRISTENFRALE